MLLAGDIGGTKTRLAIFASKDTLRTPIVEGTLPSAQYSSLEALVSDFLSQGNYSLSRACFGVAGPVIAGRAKVTNLPWNMEEEQLASALHIPTVFLLNDLYATAHAIPLLEERDLYTLNTGNPSVHGNLAVIAPGTGLGEAFLTWNAGAYIAHASEGGHTDFAPTTEREIGLLRYMHTEKKFAHVSYEHVCSGVGLPNLYDYLRATSGISELPNIKEVLATAEDPNPIIVAAAKDKEHPSPLCQEVVKLFMHILGAEAGNLALKMLATGGIFVGGGIPLHLLTEFDDGEFLSGFQNKGRFTDMLRTLPVHVITNKQPALLGAAYYGFDM